MGHFENTMKKLIHILTFTLVQWGCDINPEKKRTYNATSFESPTSQSDEPIQDDILRQEIFYIEDSSQYDKTFLDALELICCKPSIILADNYILNNYDYDTAYFPEDLQLGKETKFSGIKDNFIYHITKHTGSEKDYKELTKRNYKYLLSLTRTNLTNVNYSFQLLDKQNNLIESQSGKAVLNHNFHIDRDFDYDDKDSSGASYSIVEYRDETDSCYFAIRVGLGTDINGKLLARVYYACDDKNKHRLYADDCPTLRTD